MRKWILLSCAYIFIILVHGAACANEQLGKMSQNPKDWVMPAGNYANWRFTELIFACIDPMHKVETVARFCAEILPRLTSKLAPA